ncbi:MAG: type I glyceraldehyde-3-phosphate dehydrogenase [Thermoanaerobaculia bacterium]|nr:type I glyceraldehyde-3-phosphate dehydrogenase [Thermoanaerobaculia bacterium]
MGAISVGLVGCGRIGRNLVRILAGSSLGRSSGIELAAIVDRTDPETLEYLLRFDTLLGRFPTPIVRREGLLEIDGREIALLAPPAGPQGATAPDWKALGVKVVIEATETQQTRRALEAHLANGAERVLVCSPSDDLPDATIVVGVNEKILGPEHRIISAGSVTANCAAPVLKVLAAEFALDRVFLTSVHAYSNQLRLADVPADDMRSGRAAAENIIPQPTNADELIAALVPELAGKISGLAINVPVPNGSIVDLTCWHPREVTAEAINAALRAAAEKSLYGILAYETEPIVSSDILLSTYSGTFDSLSTMVVAGRVSKTLTFFDNGWGYCHRVIDLLRRLSTFTREDAR